MQHGFEEIDPRVSTPEEIPVLIPVLANDSDPEGDTLTIGGNTPPSHGTLADNGNGTFTYTPDTDFNGVDTFT